MTCLTYKNLIHIAKIPVYLSVMEVSVIVNIVTNWAMLHDKSCLLAKMFENILIMNLSVLVS